MEKFNSVEDVLFWFCKCKMLRYDLLQKDISSSKKVCSIDDIEIILTRLLLSRTISADHIKVLKKYSDQSIIPVSGMDDDYDVFLWENLMDILFPVFLKKGFLQAVDDVKSDAVSTCKIQYDSDLQDLKNDSDTIADTCCAIKI